MIEAFELAIEELNARPFVAVRQCWSCGATMKQFGQDFWYSLWSCPGCGIEQYVCKDPEERGCPAGPISFIR